MGGGAVGNLSHCEPFSSPGTSLPQAQAIAFEIVPALLSKGQSDMARPTPTPVRFTRHLSPSKGERKGARGRRFLSPVDRGRGGLRSEPEWGSTSHAIALRGSLQGSYFFCPAFTAACAAARRAIGTRKGEHDT